MNLSAEARVEPEFPSFFVAQGGGFLPAAASRSPWNPAHMNGVAVAGLLAYAVEQAPCHGPMLTVSMMIEFLRPAPFAVVRPTTEVTRDGRKMQMIESSLLDSEGQVTVRARVTRLRRTEGPGAVAPLDYPPPESITEKQYLREDSLIGALVERRVVHGGYDEPGPGAMWARVRADLLPGVPSRGLIQTAMLADFGSGVSTSLSRADWNFPNIDIAIHQARDPVGDWQLLIADTLMQGTGVGLVNTVMADRTGAFGHAHQTLFVEPKAR